MLVTQRGPQTRMSRRLQVEDAPSSLLEDANEELSVLRRRKHSALCFQREVIAGCMNTSICLPALAGGRCDVAQSCWEP